MRILWSPSSASEQPAQAQRRSFGIPGAFKNALDWTVGAGALYRKPVTALSVAPRGRGMHVRHALDSVFTALDCTVSWHHIPIHPSLLDDGEIREPQLIRQLTQVVETLSRW